MWMSFCQWPHFTRLPGAVFQEDFMKRRYSNSHFNRCKTGNFIQSQNFYRKGTFHLFIDLVITFYKHRTFHLGYKYANNKVEQALQRTRLTIFFNIIAYDCSVSVNIFSFLLY